MGRVGVNKLDSYIYPFLYSNSIVKLRTTKKVHGCVDMLFIW